MELKTMPNVLKKFERVIKTVDLTKEEDSKEQLYTVTLDRHYKVNGKDTDTITGKTVKEVRSTIRANRLLSAQSKEDKASKEVESKKSAKTEKLVNDVLEGKTEVKKSTPKKDTKPTKTNTASKASAKQPEKKTK